MALQFLNDGYFAGKVGIGTDSPGRLLELSKSVQGGQGATLRLTNAIGGAGAGVAIEFYGPGAQGIHAKIKTEDLGAFDSNLILQTKATASAGALSDRLTIDNVGAIQFNDYDAGYLKTDSDGNVTADSTLPGTGTFLPLAGGTLTGALVIDTAGGAEKMTFNNEHNTAPIADSFIGNTSKSYITFGVVAGSNDPGFIMHESSSVSAYTNQGVIHLCPSDDNSTNDYVSIHGTNDADVTKLHTSGLIETVNLQMQLKSGLNAVYVNDDLQVENGGSFGGNLSVNGSNITINGAYPRFNMYSTDVGEDDYSIINNNGIFGIYNTTQATYFLSLAATTGNATFNGTIGATNFSGTSSGSNTGDQTNISGNSATTTLAANSSKLGGYTLAQIDHAEAFHTFDNIDAASAQARRYHIGRLYGCPAHWDGNWQNIEFNVTAESYESGHLRYKLMGDYGGSGTQANMMDLYLKEASGPMVGRFRFVLGTPVDAGWDHSGQDTFYVDLYAEASHYSQWQINIKTYGHGTQNTNPTSGGATTVFYDSPTASNISTFNEGHTTIKHLTNEIFHEGHLPTFAEIDTTPTTIAGYGITDALVIGTTSTTAMAGNTTIPAAVTDFVSKASGGNFGDKIGIGTTAPEFALHLSKNVDSTGLNTGVMLEMASSTATDPAGMRFKSTNNSAVGYMQNLYDGATLRWKNWDGSAYSTRMALTNAGGLTLAGDLVVNGSSSGIHVDSVGHASVRLDRASTDFDNNILFYTAGVLKWRLWQDGSDNQLYIRDEVNSRNMVTFNNDNSTNFAGNVTITGNLTVDGTQTILNTQTVEVEDNIIVLNKTQSDSSATATTSGISIYRGLDSNDVAITEASLIFDDADDTWDLTNKLKVSSDLTTAGNLFIGSTGSENFIAFKGTTGDSTSGYSTTYIGEYLYGGTEKSELILYKGNDGHSSTSGYDRIRMIGAHLCFDVYNTAQSYPTTLAGVAGLTTTRAMTILEDGKTGIGTETPAVKLEVDGVLMTNGGTWNGGGTEADHSDVGLVIQENDFIFTKDGSNLRKLIGKTSDSIQIGQGGTALIDSIEFYSGTTPLYRFFENTTEIMRLNGTGLSVGHNNPQAKLDIQPTATNRKVTRISNDVMSTYFYNSQVDAVLDWTCGSYYQGEVVITANQTNGGDYNNLYIRGIWSNNHESHHWDEIERIGGLTSSTFTMSVGQNTTTNSGKLTLTFDYTSGSFAQLNVRVTDFYGSHSYTIT